MIGELLLEVDSWIGHGLVRAVCALPGLLESSLQLPGQEKHFGILFIPLRVVVHEIQLSLET